MALHLKNSFLSFSIVLLMILSLYSLASAQNIAPPPLFPGAPAGKQVGTATFAESLIPSACFEGVDKGNLVAGVNDNLFAGGQICGQKFQVTCVGGLQPGDKPCKPGTSVTVTITDSCNGKECRTFNLSQDAFSSIANPVAGVIKIAFKKV